MRLPLTSRVIDAAFMKGLIVDFDSNCGTCQNGLVTVRHPSRQGRVVIEVKCARDAGLVFVPTRSTYKTLQETIDALGVGALL